MTYTPNNATLPAGVVYNPSGNTLPKFQAALNRVANNAGNARILYVGSSTVEGENSGGPNVWELAHTLESIMAGALTSVYGLPANADSMFASTLAINDLDPRVVIGAGWIASTIVSIGGQCFTNTTNTNTLAYTMPTTADKVNIWYATDNSGSPTLGTFSWAVNGGAATNVAQGTSAPGVSMVTVTMTPGSNTLNIKRVSGTAVIIGVEPYLSTLSTINIINCGIGGIIASDYTAGSKAYNTNTAWNAVSPDLTIIQLDNNDAIAGTVVSAYKTAITSIITGSNNGDCLLVAQVPYGAAGGTVANLAAYIVALEQIAVASSVPLIDQTKWITSYDSVLTPIGWSNNDGLHASPLGYIGQSFFITDQLMNMVNVKASLGSHYFNGVTDIVGATLGFTSLGVYWMTAQAILNVAGAPLINGTARTVIRAADSTTGGGAGVGAGIGCFFDDGTGVPRMGGALWAQKFDSTSGNVGADTFLGARANGGSVSTVLKLSAQSGVSTFTGDAAATGNILATTAGKGLSIKSGSNARVGTGTLASGTLTVANTSVTANTRVFLQDTTSGTLTNVGTLTVVTTAGTGFVVKSSNVLDTSTFNWLLVESA